MISVSVAGCTPGTGTSGWRVPPFLPQGVMTRLMVTGPLAVCTVTFCWPSKMLSGVPTAMVAAWPNTKWLASRPNAKAMVFFMLVSSRWIQKYQYRLMY